MSRFAVVGNPVGHSLSPVIHAKFARELNMSISYEKILSSEQLFERQVTDFFDEGGQGLNITSPFKQRAFALADERTPRCLSAKAANTLWREGTRLFADNTDGIGFIRDIARYITLNQQSVLLLGAGGAARGILGELLSSTVASVTVVNRTAAHLALLMQDFPEVIPGEFETLEGVFDIIINATSMSLHNEHAWVPASIIQQASFCYDLAYLTHGCTLFVQDALSLGCAAMDGLGMLVEQAAESFYIWHGIRPKTDGILEQLRKG